MNGESLRALGNRLWHDRLYIVVAGLFLGIGTAFATLGFSMFYTFWLQPLPYPDAHRLVVFRQILPAFGLTGYSSSAQLEKLLKQRPHAGVQKLALLGNSRSAIATVNGEKQLLHYRRVSPDFFSLLVHHPYLGRWPSAAASHQGGPAEAVVSYTFWQQAFAGKPSAIGSEIEIKGRFYQVVGVLSKNTVLSPMAWADVYLPLVQPLPMLAEKSIDKILLGELSPGVSPRALQPWLTSIVQEQISKVPLNFRKHDLQGYRIVAAPLRDALVYWSGVGKLSWFFLGVGIFLWIVAVVNVVNYALLRHRVLLRGYAIRQLLGATQARLALRLLATEVPMLVLALVVAPLLVLLGIHALASLGYNTDTVFALQESVWIWLFLLFLLLLSAFSAVAMPLWYLRPGSLKLALTGDERTASLSRSTRRIFQGLGLLQLTLAITLLSTAFAVTAAGYSLGHRSPGFRPKGLQYTQVYLPLGTPLSQAWAQMKNALAGDPYVRESAFSQGIPWLYTPNYTTATSNVRSGKVILTIVSNKFFSLLGIPLEQGERMPSPTPQRLSGLWLSHGACRVFFPNQDCIGNSLKMAGQALQVSGMVPTISWSLIPSKQARGAVYLPLNSVLTSVFSGNGGIVLLKMPVTSESAKKMTLVTLRRALPDAIFKDFRSYPQLIKKRHQFFAYASLVLVVFAIFVTAISLFGTYTVQATMQNARLSEYRIRRILGAQTQDFYRNLFRELSLMAIPGMLIGGALATLLVHVTENRFPHILAFLLPAIAAAILIISLALGVAISRNLYNLLKLS